MSGRSMPVLARVAMSLLALVVAGGASGAAHANDDVQRLSRDPANVVMPSIAYNGWNFSPLDQINLKTVKNLALAWTARIEVVDGHEASPLVIGDSMFIVSPKPNYVYALDLARDGAVKWVYRPIMNVALATANTCCGEQTRALYYAEGKIFYATLDGQIIALDAKRGEELWRTVGTDIVRGEGMGGNGLIVHNLFLVGNEGGERGVRGKIHAYDIDTGKNAWTYYNMGPNDEVGIGPRFKPFYADDRVPNPALVSWYGDSWKRGGGTTWGYYTWDPELDIMYYSTGSCAPWNPDIRREWGLYETDANGGLTSYRNNYCASQMARDATTGELIWAYNITPADPWDLDEPVITPLIDLEIGGQTRRTAIKAGRSGWFYAFDRASGELIVEPWMHTYSDITLGVDMTTGRPKYDPAKWVFSNVADRRKYTQADPLAGRQSAGYTGTEVEYCPGAVARNWENDAYSPLTKLLYAHTDNSCALRILSTGDYRQGEGYTQRAAEDAGLARTIGIDGKPTKVQSELKAFDPVGRRIAWSMPVDDNSRTPQMATAGGLIFKGLNGKNQLVAIDAANGQVVWTFRSGARFNASPITYLFNGAQHIAVISSSLPFNNAIRVDCAPDNAKRYRRSSTTLYVFKLRA